MRFLSRKPIILLSILLLLAVTAAALSPTVLASTYIANSNTGKFHYAGCRWVAKMYDSHKVYFDSREDAINAGYIPCKVCHP